MSGISRPWSERFGHGRMAFQLILGVAALFGLGWLLAVAIAALL
jgi:hypothetical protein